MLLTYSCYIIAVAAIVSVLGLGTDLCIGEGYSKVLNTPVFLF